MRSKRKQDIHKKGKIIVAVCFICIIGILISFTGAKMSDKKMAQGAISTVSAQELQVTAPSSKKLFKKSHLQQTYAEKIREEKLQKQRQEQVIEDKQNKAIYLTFDDGPSASANQLLDVLDQYHMKATFFMLGPNVQTYPQAVKRMVKQGHAVGSHGITHNAKLFYQSATAPLKEMQQDQQIIAKTTGVQSKLVRTPYGSIPYLTEAMRNQLAQQHFQVWDWNVDSRDWAFNSSNYVNYAISQIVQVEQNGETPIVLLHDKPETIQYLPRLLEYLKANGYHTKTLTNDMAAYTFKCEGRCHPMGN